jgi:hypothetical protein
LNPSAGTTTQSGDGGPARRTGTLRPWAVLTAFSHAHDADVKSRRGDSRQLDQFVGRLQPIDDRREAEIEDAVESEHVDTHGDNDTDNVVSATGLSLPRRRGILYRLSTSKAIDCL